MSDQITRATELVAGFGDECKRRAKPIEEYKKEAATVVGDGLLAAAFVSCARLSMRSFRERLVDEVWKPFLEQGKACIAWDPINVICHDSLIAVWNNNGLPNDYFSVENAVVTTSCRRSPLFTHPQFRTINWIHNDRTENNLNALRFGHDDFVDTPVMAVENGESRSPSCHWGSLKGRSECLLGELQNDFSISMEM